MDKAHDIQILNVFMITLKKQNISNKLIWITNSFKVEQKIASESRIELRIPFIDKISKQIKCRLQILPYINEYKNV